MAADPIQKPESPPETPTGELLDLPPMRREEMEELRGTLQAAVDVLDARLGRKQPLYDPRLLWMERHPEELMRYRGKRIAVHAVKGIVASGDTLVEVSAKADALGYGMEDVLLAVAPAL